jgi:transcriptional regulator with XRE-family HTH domain
VLVRDALARKGWDQKDLAGEINTDPATITRLMKGEPTRVAHEVAEVLQLPPPYILVESLAEAQWVELGRHLRQLDPERYQRVVEQVERAVRSIVKISEADQAIAEIAPEGASDPRAKH